MKWIDKLKDSWKEDLERLERDVFKTWQVKYGEHHIRIDNFLDEEKLYVDGQLLDHHKRKSSLERLRPYQTLQAKFTGHNGEIIKIHVVLSGLLTLNCKVKVNEQILLKDKVRIPLF